MQLTHKFGTYRDIADAVGCSYEQIAKIHAKRIIELYGIDVSRLPKKGCLPLDVVDDYFNVSKPITKKND